MGTTTTTPHDTGSAPDVGSGGRFGRAFRSWAGNGLLTVVGPAVAVQAGAAVTEELMFRGLALQALEQLWGSRVAVVITGLFFGAAHLIAPGADAWSTLAIALEAGVMLGAAFLWRRGIWFVVGLHFAWSLAEQLLGIPVSGHTPEGLFTVDVHGSALLTGGGFGLETSIVPVVIGVLLALRMFSLARRSGGLRPGRRFAPAPVHASFSGALGPRDGGRPIRVPTSSYTETGRSTSCSVQLAAQAARARAVGEHEQCALRLARALELWKGQPLGVVVKMSRPHQQ